MTTPGSDGSSTAVSTPVALAGRRLEVSYGLVPVLHGVDIEVRAGEVVVLLGPNGAGKTTLLRVLAGFVRPTQGIVELLGAPVADPPYRRARRGLGYVGDDRNLFPGLTVAENFRLVDDGRNEILTRFPELAARVRSRGALLSGGEQQMLALGRTLARHPDVLIIDELSLGLAPLVRGRLLEMLRTVADRGRAVLVVEQNVHSVLEVADRAYVMRRGEMVDDRPAREWIGRLDDLGDFYFS